MPDEGKCAICGYRAPITAFLEAAGNGDLVPVFIKLPQELQTPFCKYLTLFKPASGRALQHSKTKRLTMEMVALVGKGYVSRKDKVDRPCTPSMWVQGIEKMLEQVGNLELPMKNHNYLRSIVYQIADQADARKEKHQNQEIINGNAQAHRDLHHDRQQEENLSQFERLYIDKHGQLPSMEGAGADCVNELAAAWRRKGNADEPK